ncbi:hypothetical protein ACO22_07453 [Paracoccidioides brasiliensis]|uniref:Uncharacterized protein n=1 Tax=Paracoccidioides brasiliensis TaxID=121759 RepID=A0A1D2J4N5_PARBR|nr:hypothetical protein ACO22_07453 [Paracoccidioides brasiliensis]
MAFIRPCCKTDPTERSSIPGWGNAIGIKLRDDGFENTVSLLWVGKCHIVNTRNRGLSRLLYTISIWYTASSSNTRRKKTTKAPKDARCLGGYVRLSHIKLVSGECHSQMGSPSTKVKDQMKRPKGPRLASTSKAVNLTSVSYLLTTATSAE